MITQHRLKELFDYNGQDLVWKVSRGSVKTGSVSGCITKRGYKRTKVDNKKYFTHRLIWLYHYGSFPTYQLDHIDHNPLNNNINNLRDIPQSENTKNMSKYKNNTSGVTGVVWSKRTDKWSVSGTSDNKHHNLGYFTDKFDAICARKSWEVKNGFHNNHGR